MAIPPPGKGVREMSDLYLHHGLRRWKNELQLFRVFWMKGAFDGKGYDNKVSAKIIWEPRDLWLGLYWDVTRLGASFQAIKLYLCIVPCLPLRVHYKRSYGGSFGRA